MTALAGGVLTACFVIIAGASVAAVSYIREARKAGGLRAMYAQAAGNAPAPPLPEPEATGVPWYLEPSPPARPRPWERAVHAETAGVPPWGDVTLIDGVPLFGREGGQ